MSEHPHVKLGRYTDPGLPVYPQAPQRILRRLGRLGDAVGAAAGADGLDAQTFLSSLGDRVYYLFVTFIPNLPERMPEWEFWGYGSRDAYDSGDFDEDRDGENAATFPQWLEAFDTIIEVNGGKRFMDLLGKVFPPEWLKLKVAELFEEGQDLLSGSLSSPGTNGKSPQTSSGGTSPTQDDSDTTESEKGAEQSSTLLSVSA